jgi:hypothetical protein
LGDRYHPPANELSSDGVNPNPKGGGEYRGIGLLEPIWKVLDRVMDLWLENIKLHDSLHGCLAGRGTGTGSFLPTWNQNFFCFRAGKFSSAAPTTEGKLHQTASCTASRQCVETNGAGAGASNDGKHERWWGNLIGVQHHIQLASHLGPENTLKLVQVYT